MDEYIVLWLRQSRMKHSIEILLGSLEAIPSRNYTSVRVKLVLTGEQLFARGHCSY